MENTKYSIYILRTNPCQKSEWGGVSYKERLIFSNYCIDEENLRIIVHDVLNIPYMTLFQPMWTDPTNDDWTNNIEIENYKVTYPLNNLIDEIKKDDYEFKFNYILTLKNYPEQMPDSEATFKEIDKHKTLEILKNIHENHLREIKEEDRQRALKQAKSTLRNLDKQTLLTLLSELIAEENK